MSEAEGPWPIHREHILYHLSVIYLVDTPKQYNNSVTVYYVQYLLATLIKAIFEKLILHTERSLYIVLSIQVTCDHSVI